MFVGQDASAADKKSPISRAATEVSKSSDGDSTVALVKWGNSPTNLRVDIDSDDAPLRRMTHAKKTKATIKTTTHSPAKDVRSLGRSKGRKRARVDSCPSDYDSDDEPLVKRTSRTTNSTAKPNKGDTAKNSKNDQGRSTIPLTVSSTEPLSTDSSGTILQSNQGRQGNATPEATKYGVCAQHQNPRRAPRRARTGPLRPCHQVLPTIRASPPLYLAYKHEIRQPRHSSPVRWRYEHSAHVTLHSKGGFHVLTLYAAILTLAKWSTRSVWL